MRESPVIGISCYSARARWEGSERPAVLLPRQYTDMVAAAGGLPVLLPPLPGGAGVLARLDGLVLSGGRDIDPARYGAPRNPACGPANPDRDSCELALARHALQAGLPVLGICRGLQVINVALGGTLIQHLPDVVGHAGHSPGQAGYGMHKVSIAPGSRLAALLGRTQAAVPTRHHQAIRQLGDGLIATAWADDGVVEAAELQSPDVSRSGSEPGPARAFMIAVQWHPEAGDDPSLFDALIAAASRRLDGAERRIPAPPSP